MAKKTPMPKLDIYDLSIEVTRRCNLHCQHCLRGDCQDADIDLKLITKLFKQTARVGSIIFSGGEPSLNVKAIPRIMAIAKRYDVSIDGFYIVTNGIANQKELAVELLKLYCDMPEKDMCGVAISVDRFHDGKDQTDIVKGLAFYRDDKEHEPNDSDGWIMRIGRAEDYKMGRNPSWLPTSFDIDSYYEHQNPDNITGISVDMVYLSTNGYVYPSCDLSYKIMDAAKIIPVESLQKVCYEHVKDNTPECMLQLKDILDTMTQK